jgi:hypothetical protein
MFLRRTVLSAVGAFAAFALATGPAAAHFCYNTQASARAWSGMVRSGSFMSFHDLAALNTGLCDAGIAVLAAAAGVNVNQPINVRSIMAGGTLKKARSGTPAISHLDFAAIEAAFPAAIRACS